MTERSGKGRAMPWLRNVASASERMMRALLLCLLWAYRLLLAPLLGGRCRFEPTCSEYARRALRAQGAFRGALSAVRRLGRCHPFSGSYGVDLPPGSLPPEDDGGMRSTRASFRVSRWFPLGAPAKLGTPAGSSPETGH